MERFVMMSMISDGKLYKAEDLVKADTNGCSGCSFCCHAMCDTIVLDPWDCFFLERGLKTSFSELLSDGRLEIGLHDLLNLPNIKGTDHGCSFLDASERCTVHGFRPGFCRLFPLGRFYHDEDFSYFLQIHECKKAERGEIRVSDWLGIPELSRYESYVNTWHYFLKNLTQFMRESSDREAKIKIRALLLSVFYEKEYDLSAEFYGQFEARMEDWSRIGF